MAPAGNHRKQQQQLSCSATKEVPVAVADGLGAVQGIPMAEERQWGEERLHVQRSYKHDTDEGRRVLQEGGRFSQR